MGGWIYNYPPPYLGKVGFEVHFEGIGQRSNRGFWRDSMPGFGEPQEGAN